MVYNAAMCTLMKDKFQTDWMEENVDVLTPLIPNYN